jgi:hypothetical protein
VTASSEQKGAIYAGIEKILFLVNRGAAYELQLRNLQGRLSANNLGNFEDSLVKLYKYLLEFLATAVLIKEKTSFQRALYALWTPQDVSSFSEDCIKLEATLEIESRLVESQCNREATENVERILKASDCLDKTITNTASLINGLRLEMEEKRDILEALDWVSSIPIRDHHDIAKEGRTPYTCQWVFRKREFWQWESSQGPSLLWIHGIREFPDNQPSSLLF